MCKKRVPELLSQLVCVSVTKRPSLGQTLPVTEHGFVLRTGRWGQFTKGISSLQENFVPINATRPKSTLKPSQSSKVDFGTKSCLGRIWCLPKTFVPTSKDWTFGSGTVNSRVVGLSPGIKTKCHILPALL
jgi:hypothetical protein